MRQAPTSGVEIRTRLETVLINVFGLILVMLIAFVIVLSQLDWVGTQVTPLAAALLRVGIMTGFIPTAAYCLAVVALIYLLVRPIPRSWRMVAPLAALTLGAATAISVLWILAATNALGVDLTDTTKGLTIATFAAVALALWSMLSRNQRAHPLDSPPEHAPTPAPKQRSPHWHTPVSRRLGNALAVVAFLLAGTIGINADFGLYRTPGAMAGIATSKIITLPKIVTPTASPSPTVLRAGGALWANWVAPVGVPDVGTITQVDIPHTVSGFASRSGQLYLPPAALVKNPPVLPLVILMMGQPGNPDVSFAAKALDVLAARHGGLAPIVLTVDQLGNPAHDTLCVDSAKYGNVETFIVRDALEWAHSHLRVLTDAAHTTVAGYSAGGACSLYLGSKYPTLWGNVLDISGEIYSGSERSKATLAEVFRGNQAAYEKIKPLNILLTGHYPDTTAIFTVGSNDGNFRGQAQKAAAATTTAGWTSTYFEVPNGGHVGTAIEGGMVEGFRVLYPRLGLSMPGINP